MIWFVVYGDAKMEPKLKEYFKERNWALENYKALQEKYPDQWVAVKSNKVVSHGKDIENFQDAFTIFVTSGAEVFFV